MNIPWTYGLLVLIYLCDKSYSGTICLSCNNLADGELCTGVEMCKQDEVCYIQKYTTNGNEYRYDVGCAYPELCRKDLTGHILGRRSDHSHLLCHKCCNNSDICNARLSCNDTISVSQQRCSSCSEIEDPRMCKNTTTCTKDEICYLHKYTTHSKQQLYDLGCKHSVLCTHGYTNILGRRSSLGVHQECESCCSGTELCNHDLQCDHHTQKTYNSTCSAINECSASLVCLSGICRCPSDEYYWDGNTCFERKAVNERCSDDSNCKPSLQCLQNMCHCVQTEYWNGSLCISRKIHDSVCVTSDECLGTLYCNHGHCKCDRMDFWSGSLCETRKTFNATCSTHEQCTNTLRCIDNACKCTQEDYLNGTQCLSKKSVNSTCNTNEQCRSPYKCYNYVCQCTQLEYWNGRKCLSKKTECEDIEDTRDGVYTIYPGGGERAVDVYCIMGQSKKWTVIQRRVNGSVDFYRTWQEYKHGFGSVYGEYWLGNDYIHLISTNGIHELGIYMQDGSQHCMANYSSFSVGDERSKYRLTVTGYSGDAGADSMDKVPSNVKSNGQPFTTKDKDNDNNSNNLAVEHRSAWWFNDGFWSDFNYAYNGNNGQMYWAQWSGQISKSILMIRRTS